jgi:hypothetical protein
MPNNTNPKPVKSEMTWEQFIAPRPSQFTNQLLYKNGKPVLQKPQTHKESVTQVCGSWGTALD